VLMYNWSYAKRASNERFLKLWIIGWTNFEYFIGESEMFSPVVGTILSAVLLWQVHNSETDWKFFQDQVYISHIYSSVSNKLKNKIRPRRFGSKNVQHVTLWIPWIGYFLEHVYKQHSIDIYLGQAHWRVILQFVFNFYVLCKLKENREELEKS